jgi:hypothetical protein
MRLTDANWTAILKALKNAEKYVSLDLSSCTSGGSIVGGGLYADGTFAPLRSTAAGEPYIVSLTLPRTAAAIRESSDILSVPFRHFAFLKTVSGGGVETIGSCAFYGCRIEALNFPAVQSIGERAFSGCFSLETASFPLAESVGHNAFSGCASLKSVNLPLVTFIDRCAFYDCTVLKSVNFPAATFIGEGAFAVCTALAKADLPAATSVGNSAFSGCTSLTAVNLPAAVFIGQSAFWYTGTAALTVNLPRAAPLVSADSFSFGTPYSKTVTVRTPAGRSGYSDAWKTDFRELFDSYAAINLAITDL